MLEKGRADIAFLMSADHTEGLVTVSRAGYAVRVVGDRKEETYLDHIRDFAPAILINDLPAPLRSLIERLLHYVIMGEDQALVVALWIVLTWLHEQIAVHSPISPPPVTTTRAM